MIQSRHFGVIATWLALWASACSVNPPATPQAPVVVPAPEARPAQPPAKPAEPKAPAPKVLEAPAPKAVEAPAPAPKAVEAPAFKGAEGPAPAAAPEAPKPKLKPGVSDLHAVYADAAQLMRIDLQTGESTPLGMDRVVAATQDGEGHWWVVQAQGEKHVLLRIPAHFEASEAKVVVAEVPGDSGYFELKFGKDEPVRMVALKALRRATESCGGMSGRLLCNDAMGWSNYETWTWAPTAAQLEALGLTVPKAAKRSKVTSVPLRPPFSRKHCRCWGNHYKKCGSTTPLGESGWTLMLTGVECGDMAHPSCVLRRTGKGDYSAFSEVKFTTDLRWRGRPPKGGSCGPFYLSSSGDWISDGKGVFCTLGKDAVCTEPAQGIYLGTVGEALLRIELP